MALKRFTKPKFLEQIGRGLLQRLLERHRPEFERHGVVLPEGTLADPEFYAALARLSLAEGGLPESFVEELYGIEVLANDYGQSRLQQAVAEAGLELDDSPKPTHADYAVQVLLAQPQLFALKLEQARISGLSSFEYYGSQQPVDRRASFGPPTAETKAFIKRDIDEWLARQREGEEQLTELEAHPVDGEWWFLIRRGDAYARVPAVDGSTFTVRHFRPARDLVVAYSPQWDELRLHATGVHERKLLRRVFGYRLFGQEDYFSVRRVFTLEPLREKGPEALTVTPGRGIERILLKELQVRSNDEHDAVLTFQASDLFAYAAATGQPIPPPSGQLVRAGLEVHYTGQPRPRMAYLREGNRLRLTRHCDAPALHECLTAQCFRRPERETGEPAAGTGL